MNIQGAGLKPARREECQRIGHSRAVVDLPFSPFVNLSIGQMTQLGQAGVNINFTYDEISPLLGVDPTVAFVAASRTLRGYCY